MRPLAALTLATCSSYLCRCCCVFAVETECNVAETDVSTLCQHLPQTQHVIFTVIHYVAAAMFVLLYVVVNRRRDCLCCSRDRCVYITSTSVSVICFSQQMQRLHVTRLRQCLGA